jgi:hypothetical protein
MASRNHTAVRLDPATIAKLEALRASFSTQWRDATLSDALRAVIEVGLTAMEKKVARAARKRPSAR